MILTAGYKANELLTVDMYSVGWDLTSRERKGLLNKDSLSTRIMSLGASVA